MTFPSPDLNPLNSTLRTIYLGTPGAMVSAKVPDAGVQYPLTRGGGSSQLLSGGTSATRRPKTRRTYSFSWSNRMIDELNDIVGFYAGLRGDGPFCLIDPAWRNLYGPQVGTFGRQFQSISGWAPTASARPPSYDGTTTPSVGVAGGNCGVLRWAPANNDVLIEAASYTPAGTLVTPDIDSVTKAGTAVPWLPSQIHTISVAARAVSGTNTVRLDAWGIGDTGVLATLQSQALIGTATALSTAWQTLATAVPRNFFPATVKYVITAVTCLATGAPILLSNPQHEIGVSVPSAWAVPLGVPRVIVADDSAAASDYWDRQTQTLKLPEI